MLLRFSVLTSMLLTVFFANAQSQLNISSLSGVLCEDENFSITVTRGTFPTAFSNSAVSFAWEIDGVSVTSSSSTKSVFSANANKSWNGKKLKCTVTDGTNTASVESSQLQVWAKPNVTSNPSNEAVCDGGNAEFKVTASGAYLRYQWQENDGSGWSNLSNGGIFSGARTSKLKLFRVTRSMNGYDYRCSVDNTPCNADISNSANLRVDNSPAITSNGSNRTICSGSNTTFSVSASGSSLNYQWQLSTNNGSSWSNLSNAGVYSGTTTSTLTITSATSSMSGYDYRCVVDKSGCSSVTSTSKNLTVQTAPSITSSGSNSTICVGSNTTFSVSASGSSLNYQWQLSTNNGTSWSNLSNGGVYSGAITRTLSISSATSSMSGYDYRCVVDNSGCSSVTSSSRNLTVQAAPSITSSGSNRTICDGSNTTFSITASGSSLSYRWQVSTNNGSSWSNVSNGGVYSGATTSTLSLTSATTSMNGYDYRCQVDNSGCSATNSSSRDLTVQAEPDITSSPSNSTACENSNTTFSVSATGSSLNYQWQLSTNNGSSWSNLSNGGKYSGATTATLRVSNLVSSMNGYDYRCVVDNSTCDAATSNSANLTVQITPRVTSDPSNDAICSNSNTSFTISASGSSLNYRWQVNGGSGWSNLSNGGGYSNVTSRTLNISSASSTLDGYEYRCIADNSACSQATSNSAELEVQSPADITSSPINDSTCESGNLSFSVSVDGTYLTYRWQENSGSGWSNLNNGASSGKGTYSGATTRSLTISGANSNIDEYDYRLFADNSECPSDISSSAMAVVQETPTITIQPQNDEVCENEDAEFSVSVSGTYLEYQWQENAGSGFSNLVNSTNYTGTISPKLVVANTSRNQDENIYRLVLSNTQCPSITSGEGELNIRIRPRILSGLTDVEVCADTNFIEFDLSVEGYKLTYEWFLKRADESSFSSTGVITKSFKKNRAWFKQADGSAGLDGAIYQIRVSGYCAPVNASDVLDESSITVNPFVKPTFELAGLTCERRKVEFNNTSSLARGSASYKWFFGDGVKTTEINAQSIKDEPSHWYTSNGSYKVHLYSTTNKGCHTDTAYTVSINPLPEVRWDRDYEICEDESVTFTNLSSIQDNSSLEYSWNFDDGNSSTSESPIHFYGTPDNFRPTLYAKSASTGCDSLLQNPIDVSVNNPGGNYNYRFNKLVRIHRLPDVDFEFENVCDLDDAEFVNRSTVTPIDNSNDKELKFTWDFGDNTTTELSYSGSQSDGNATKKYGDGEKAFGTYNVQLTVETDSSCISATSKSITIYQKPTQPKFIDPVDKVCKGTQGQRFQVEQIQNVAYSWVVNPYHNGIRYGDQRSMAVNIPNFGENESSLNQRMWVRSLVTDSNNCVDSIRHWFKVDFKHNRPKSEVRMNRPNELVVIDFKADSFEWGGDFKLTGLRDSSIAGKYPTYVQADALDTANINYWVKTYNDNGCYTKNYYDENFALGIYNGIKEHSISVFPNPNSGNIQVIIDDDLLNRSFNLNLLDLTGKSLMGISQKELFNESFIDINHLGNGVYFLNYTSELGSITIKLIKE